MTKAYSVSMMVIEAAYEEVRENQGAAGVDRETIEEFSKKTEDNLYKIWNRMSSGCYFPPAVRTVEIPKKDGQKRKLGIPTVSDRIAQTVTKMYLEPAVEPKFHPDSYGFRPGKNQRQAIEVTRQRCWRYDWVIDLDIKAFFDNLDHSLLLNAVRIHTDIPWVLLYTERWLKAPIQETDGTLSVREKGTPQGGVISPLLANIYLHHAFDEWMKERFSYVPFERYADDIVVHCKTEAQAKFVLTCIVERLNAWKLELHPEKTRIVYCKDDNRKGTHTNTKFDFLGFTFCAREARNKRDGRKFGNFLPAMSDKARKEKRSQINKWNLQRRTDLSIKELAELCNAEIRGWGYYGAFYKTKFLQVLLSINLKLVKWVKRKYNKSTNEAWKWLKRVCSREPTLFAHWKMGLALPER